MERPTGYDEFFHVRCYSWQKELAEKAAAVDGRFLSDYVRTVLTDVSRRRISRAEVDADR